MEWSAGAGLNIMIGSPMLEIYCLFLQVGFRVGMLTVCFIHP